MEKIIVALLLCLCASCAVPFTQLSSDVAVKQVAYKSGPFYHTVETSIKNTSEHPIFIVARCSAETGGMVDARYAVVQPGAVFHFKDKVPSRVDGSVSASCDYYRK